MADLPDFSNMDLKQSIRKSVTNKDAANDNSMYTSKAGMMRRLMSQEDEITPEISPNVNASPVDQTDTGGEVQISPPDVDGSPVDVTRPAQNGRHKTPQKIAPKRTICCFKIYEYNTDPHVKWPPKFHIRDLIISMWGLFTFAFDYFTDLRLMIEYFKDGEYFWFYLTVAFIAVPSFISGVISVIWYNLTYERDLKSNYKHAKHIYYARMIFSFIQLGRIFRQLEYIYCVGHTILLERMIVKLEKRRTPNGIHSEEEQSSLDVEIEKMRAEVFRLRKTATAEKRDATILGLIDGYMESALQLILQLYLSVQYGLPLNFPRVSSLVSSWVSTAMIQTSYYRANRKANKDKQNMDYVSSLIYFLWRFVELGPRYIVITLTLVFFPLYGSMVGILLHFVFVTVLYMLNKPELEGICSQPLEDTSAEKQDEMQLLEASINGRQNESKNESITHEVTRSSGGGTCNSFLNHIFIMIMGLIGVLSFINLKEGESRKISFIYYLVFYIENVALTGVFWWMYINNGLETDWVYCLFSVPVGMVLHLIFSSVFYITLHPNNTCVPPIKIKCCW